MQKTLFKILGALFVITVLFSAHSVFASTMTVSVDTLNNSINTLEATISIPRSVKISKIFDGNSILVFWIKRATIDSQTNAITFAGLTPGGFVGQHQILSIDGDFNKNDLSQISFSNVTALKNDGKGTNVQVKLSVSNGTTIIDSTPPEPFIPIISKSKYIFSGHAFISFDTQDKGVGVDHYEYAHVWFGNPTNANWQSVKSPLELTTSSLFQKIFIKAVDKSGNERIQSTVGPYYYYLHSFVWVIIIILVLCVLLYIRKYLS